MWLDDELVLEFSLLTTLKPEVRAVFSTLFIKADISLTALCKGVLCALVIWLLFELALALLEATGSWMLVISSSLLGTGVLAPEACNQAICVFKLLRGGITSERRQRSAAVMARKNSFGLVFVFVWFDWD